MLKLFLCEKNPLFSSGQKEAVDDDDAHRTNYITGERGCYTVNVLIFLCPSKFERKHDILYIEHKPKPITISKPT